MDPTARSAEDRMLEIFVGEWNNTGTVSPGPFGPGGAVTGRSNYYWDVGGKWLLYVSQLELPGLGAYEVQGGVAFNSRAGKYDAYAINNLGSLLVYDGEWTDKETLIFTLVHPQAGTARVIYEKLPADSLKMISQKVAEDGNFVSYFETDFVRA
ncbi:DUF1579 family protein [Candidatus Bipolaricaulota bacterium]